MSGENENSIFIGARTLKKEEVKIIVPTYDAIINRVEDIRREAGNKSKDNENIKKYNNTITLFGNRGTGKTSTMYTVRNELKKNINNIFLEIIEPDSIGQEGKIMGCILGLFKDEIDKLQNEIKKKRLQDLSDEIRKDFFDDCRFKENNPINKAYNDVLEYYCYTEKDYKKLLTCNYNDMNSYIKKSSHVFNADIKFEKNFGNFIDKFIKYKKKNNCNENNKNYNGSDEPLIFIFIDDVDLNTNKCQEIIEAILKYASHANIVCFITGDYSTFNEAFTISLLKQENLKEANLWPSIQINNEKTILQSKQELANEYMKKVFPPAYRHYVNTWDLSLIPKYSFSIEGNEKRADLFQLLSNLSEAKSVENIFGYYSVDDKKSGYYLPAYNMFDKTSRGLINVYYSLWNINNNLKNYNEEQYFVNIKSFIENIIDSSSQLVKYSQDIKNKYILWGANKEQSKIDFEQLYNLFEDVENKENVSKDKNSIEIKYSLFYICYYISILIPEIPYSIDKRKDVSRRAMFELLSNPKLNGYDISVNYSSYLKNYFSNNNAYFIDNYNGYNYSYNIYFKGFICEILAESNLYFAQKFYSKIVSSKLFGYEVFDEHYKITLEKYNSLYILFYQSLYNDKDTDMLMEFYNNQKLKKYMDFIEIKSNEDSELPYIEIIFKELFEGFNDSVDEQISTELDDNDTKVFRTAKDDFLLLFKLELKKICSLIPDNFNNYIMERYKEVSSIYKDEIKFINRKDIPRASRIKEIAYVRKIINLIESIYKVHENEINNRKNEDNNREQLYKDPQIFEVITKLMVNTFAYRLAEIFMAGMGSSTQFLSKNLSFNNTLNLAIDISDIEIERKLEQFLNSYTGVTQTKAFTTQKRIRRIIGEGINMKWIGICEYSQLIHTLNNLYFSNARYCRKEAKELIDTLNNKVRMMINKEPIFHENEEWIMQAYSLFIKKAKSEIIDFSELEKAKAYFRKILPEVIAKQETIKQEYLEKLGIQDDYEV